MPHQLFEALVQALPATGEVMTEQRRGAFLRAFDSMLDLVYVEEGSERLSTPEAPLLLEAPPTAEVVTPPPPAEKPAVKAASKPKSTATTVQAKAAHTGRHAFRNGTCQRDGCGAVDPRGATDPKHNPFMQPVATTPTPAVAAAMPVVATGTTQPDERIRYCVIQGCHEAIVPGGRCADGHVQGSR